MEILDYIKPIHIDCHKLCILILNTYLPVAGNIGIFTHSEEEYKQLTEISKELTKPTNNPNQKYFELHKPITIGEENNTPEATYTHLYIRKPDYTDYGKYKGDVDFILSTEEYEKLKLSVLKGDYANGATLYDRPGWDTVQLVSKEIASVAYISTKEFSKKVRVKFN